MGTQNKEIKIALDIQAKIDKASNQINTLKKQIDNFELSKGLAGDFAKEFKNIEHEISELQRKTAAGEINLIDAKSAEKEIDKIEKSGKETGYSIIPMRLFINQRGLAKLVIGIGRGKKEYDKRQSIKEREDKRSMARMFEK
jgi:chaperonin cofactor prefoldin